MPRALSSGRIDTQLLAAAPPSCSVLESECVETLQCPASSALCCAAVFRQWRRRPPFFPLCSGFCGTRAKKESRPRDLGRARDGQTEIRRACIAMACALVALATALVATASLPWCAADLPVHCDINHVYGVWELFAVDAPPVPAPRLPYLAPDRAAGHVLEACDSTALGNSSGTGVSAAVRVELRPPNLVVEQDARGRRGTFTMTYDEGFELRFRGRRYTAFFRYGFDPAADLPFRSFCHETSVGQVHDLQSLAMCTMPGVLCAGNHCFDSCLSVHDTHSHDEHTRT